MVITTKRYGISDNTASYDPRYPGYFSAVFTIKGRKVEIHNLKMADIEEYSEMHDVMCIDDCMIDDCCYHKGDVLDIFKLTRINTSMNSTEHGYFICEKWKHGKFFKEIKDIDTFEKSFHLIKFLRPTY